MLEFFGKYFAGFNVLSILWFAFGSVLFLIDPSNKDAITIARLALVGFIVTGCCLFFCVVLA